MFEVDAGSEEQGEVLKGRSVWRDLGFRMENHRALHTMGSSNVARNQCSRTGLPN